MPVDTRPEVWNTERGRDLGAARLEDDKEKNQEQVKPKQKEGEEPKLSEIRMRSDQVPQIGAYVLGVVKRGAFAYLVCLETKIRPRFDRRAAFASHRGDAPTAPYTDLHGRPNAKNKTENERGLR